MHNILISNQLEVSNKYIELKEICIQKNINIVYLKQGDSVLIENDLRINVLWPEEEQITTNVLNNNSLVFKLEYNDFSMLFTGDIEEVSEKRIASIYQECLEADILKVAHHGSKSSTTEDILQYVDPKISVIGVR